MILSQINPLPILTTYFSKIYCNVAPFGCFHMSEDSSRGRLNCDAVWQCGRIPMFRRTSLSLSSGSKAVKPSETLASYRNTTRCHNPEDMVMYLNVIILSLLVLWILNSDWSFRVHVHTAYRTKLSLVTEPQGSTSLILKIPTESFSEWNPVHIIKTCFS
jgi:hypothetical protein